MWHNRGVKALLVALAAFSAAPALADTITYRDGRVVRCVIEEETPSAVTVTLHGRRVEVPRTMLSSADRGSAAENKELRASWEARKRAPATLTAAATAPPPSPAAGPGLDGAAKAGQPAPLPERQRELRWKQEVRNAIRDKRVIAGMTEKEVNSTWGTPERTHPVHGIGVSTDRWTYRREGEGLVDLYFRNGVLTQVSR